MSNQPILYLGDTALTGAACYLAGLMTHWGLGFDYVPSGEPVDEGILGEDRRLFILSDYPSAMMGEADQARLVEQVAAGAGLVMIGGWESFHGQSGCWDGTPVARILPVNISTRDDRINCDQPALVVTEHSHPITRGLPWVGHPPTIGGYNQFEPKAGCDVVLDVQRFAVQYDSGGFVFEPVKRDPLLVVGAHGKGRTAALGTDTAPHWVGGLVDWGLDRVVAQAPGSHGIEVGSDYATLVRQLLGWVGRLDQHPVPGMVEG